MKIFLLTSIISLFFVCLSSAQKQGNIWYFGDHAGVDFNSGVPIGITGGQTYYDLGHTEGSAAICDSSGQLLFYSNGEKVWNRQHLVMLHGDGLLGSSSSTQAALIVPKPGPGDSLFYLFTADGFYPGNPPYDGFRYSIINMCGDRGLGEVISQSKNTLLQDSCIEKMTVVKHANGTDYWIIVHKVFTNSFYSFLLTSSGVSLGNISSIGSVHNSEWGTIGQMKASPDGSHLALACGNGTNLMELYDFNNTDGSVSDFVDLCDTMNCTAYGVSFSPDNSKVYFTYNASTMPYVRLVQFDLTAGGGNPDSIKSSQVNIAGYLNGVSVAGMQLGPDGKIYMVPYTSLQHLSVIHYPNLPGLACTFEDTAVYLLGREVNYTLPGTIDSYDFHNGLVQCAFQPDPDFVSGNSTICPGTCTDFINLSNDATSYQWNFPGALPDTSTAINPQNICYNNPGSYDVTLIAFNSNGSNTLTLSNYITVFPLSPPQSILQSGDTLFSNQGFQTYQWYFNGVMVSGATNYFYVLADSGDYNVICTDTNGCEVEAAIYDVHIGIDEFESGGGISIYPNPVLDQLMIRLWGAKAVAKEILVYNMTGEIIMEVKRHNPNSSFHTELDVHKLIPGIYWLELNTGEKIFRIKFMKQ